MLTIFIIDAQIEISNAEYDKITLNAPSLVRFRDMNAVNAGVAEAAGLWLIGTGEAVSTIGLLVAKDPPDKEVTVEPTTGHSTLLNPASPENQPTTCKKEDENKHNKRKMLHSNNHK